MAVVDRLDYLAEDAELLVLAQELIVFVEILQQVALHHVSHETKVLNTHVCVLQLDYVCMVELP